MDHHIVPGGHHIQEITMHLQYHGLSPGIIIYTVPRDHDHHTRDHHACINRIYHGWSPGIIYTLHGETKEGGGGGGGGGGDNIPHTVSKHWTCCVKSDLLTAFEKIIS